MSQNTEGRVLNGHFRDQPLTDHQPTLTTTEETAMPETPNSSSASTTDSATLLEMQRVAAALKNGDVKARASLPDAEGEASEVLAVINSLAEHIEKRERYYSDLLGSISTCVQLADENYTITYMNPALNQMFKDAEQEIRTQLPHFDSAKLLGVNMDVFHRKADHQRQMLAGIKKPHHAEIRLGNRTFSLVATPLFDEQGKRYSTVVEWLDISVWKNLTSCLEAMSKGDISSPLVATEDCKGSALILRNAAYTLQSSLKGFIRDMQHLAEEHHKGNTDVCLESSQFEGAFRDMASGVNEMVANHMQVTKKAMACVKDFGEGNFDAMLEAFPGQQVYINHTVELVRENLKGLIDELQRLILSASTGQLSERGRTGQLKGNFAGLVEGINRMLDEILLPINEGNRVLRQISSGNLSDKMDIECHGDHQRMKNAINDVHTWLTHLIDFVTRIANGDLTATMEKASSEDQIHEWLMLLKSNIGSVSGEAATLSQAIVDGDLSIRPEVAQYEGDYRRIMESFENAFVGLNNTFYQIVDTVERVGRSASELNAASQNMAATSEEQSASVEQVTSNLEETDSQVKANTDNAKAANQLVIGTSEAANQGRQKMEEMVEAMNAINGSALSIAKIIKVIDEIAFQTNLLALNAAVEAARAGQHGRGFAVVAQEVRNLAGRSAKAARETAELIENSSRRVNEGVAIAAETREALNQIVTNVVKVKDLVAEITMASMEQSRGVSQINIAMGQVAKSAQESSQQATELASSSHELSEAANRMREEMGRFRLRERLLPVGGSFPGLDNLSPDLIRQLQLLLAQHNVQQASAPQALARPVAPMVKSSSSPRNVLPLDHDERGYGGF
ncbi:MAG: methyl-accepting chemotaxis protein [Methylococcaceae bacterium]